MLKKIILIVLLTCARIYAMEPDEPQWLVKIKLQNQLAEAINTGNTMYLQSFFKEGGNPNGMVRPDITLLQSAILVNNNTIVKFLLANNANPNQANHFNKHTPLIFAVNVGNPEIIQSLLIYKADPNLQDKEGNTPLHHATKLYFAPWKNYGLEIIKLLLEANARVDIKNNKNETPIGLAAEKDPALFTLFNEAVKKRHIQYMKDKAQKMHTQSNQE